MNKLAFETPADGSGQAHDAVPQIAFGQVRHKRFSPATHTFAYRTCFLMLPMRAMARNPSGQLARNRWSPMSFHDCDHGDGQSDALAWFDQLMAQHGIDDATGELWLQCYPRTWGHTFKPVSFWYAHHANGSLRCVVAEVNNTFGERHCYLLAQPQYGVVQRADKVFHVSPFCSVAGEYRFRFMRSAGGDRIVACVDLHMPDGVLIQTSLSGVLHRASLSTTARAVLSFPLMTLAIVGRIHWHAFRLWMKRVPFFSKPKPPTAFVTR